MDSWYDILNGTSQSEDEEDRSPLLDIARFLQQMGVLDTFDATRLAPPAAKEEVEKLKKIEIKEDSVEKCPVCLRELEEGDIQVTMPCEHHFHDQCILAWLGKTNSCPVCRFELKTDDPAYEEHKENKRREKIREENNRSEHCDEIWQGSEEKGLQSIDLAMAFKVGDVSLLKPRIENGILKGPDIPDVFNKDLVKALYKSLLEAGDSVLLTDASNGESKTASEIISEVDALKASLQNRIGLGKGDVVAVSTENRPEFLTVILAVWGLGATMGCVNHLYSQEEMSHILKKMTPKIVICSESVLPLVKATQSEVPSLEKIVVFGQGGSGTISYKELVAENAEPKIWSNPAPLEDVALLLCSSGTTGLPKVVELTYVNMHATITGLHTTFGDASRSVISMFIPLFHGFGVMILVDGVLRKSHTVTFPRFEITHVLKSCEKYKVDMMILVPPVMVLLAKHPLVDELDLSCIKVLRYGAAPCSPTLIESLSKRLPQLEFKEGYGMTEASIANCVAPRAAENPMGSVGYIVCGLNCKIVDIDTGAILGAGKEGEICLRGVQIMKGYRNDPQATAAAIDSEGWLHTGDVGYYDEEGWLFVRERIKEIIKYNAMQVSPTELETIILRLPSIRDVAVWGKPNEAAGELPMAFVVRQPGSAVTEEEITNFVADHVAAFKKLRGGVKFVEEIPKLASGKILRRKLGGLI